MREFIYYVETRSSSLSPKRNVFWKLNNEYCLAVSEDAKHEAALCATFCNKKDWPIELPKPFDNEKCMYAMDFIPDSHLKVYQVRRRDKGIKSPGF